MFTQKFGDFPVCYVESPGAFWVKRWFQLEARKQPSYGLQKCTLDHFGDLGKSVGSPDLGAKQIRFSLLNSDHEKSTLHSKEIWNVMDHHSF